MGNSINPQDINVPVKTASWWRYIFMFLGVTFVFAFITQPENDGWLNEVSQVLIILGVVVIAGISGYIITMVWKEIKKRKKVTNVATGTAGCTEKNWWKDRETSPEALEKFKRRTMWLCILVGAFAFHLWNPVTSWHAILPLLTCLTIRSFFLPSSPFSTFLLWVYIFSMMAAAFLPGTGIWASAKWDDLKENTMRSGCEAMKDSATESACLSSLPKLESPDGKTSDAAGAPLGGEILLTSEWSKKIEFVPLKRNLVYCSEPGAVMRIIYGGTDSEATIGPSGSEMPCATQHEKFYSIGTKLYNVQFNFRTDTPGVRAIHSVY